MVVISPVLQEPFSLLAIPSSIQMNKTVFGLCLLKGLYRTSGHHLGKMRGIWNNSFEDVWANYFSTSLLRSSKLNNNKANDHCYNFALI